MALLGGILALSSVLSNLDAITSRITVTDLLKLQGSQNEPAILGELDEAQNPSTVTIVTSDGDEYKYQVEIADTQEERALGFMYQEEIQPNEGILFVHDESAIHSFWMKDVNFPLDLLHIEDGEIVEIIPNMQPCIAEEGDFSICPNYPGSQASKYSLELPGGTVNDNTFRPGDKVILPDEFLETAEAE